MNKTWIIIQREFINRVSKKSFILLTILMPFIFAALIFVPLWLSTVKGGDQKQVAVIDATMKYLPQFKDDESWHFVGVPQMEASFRSDSTQFDAVVEIKADLAEHPEAVTIYSRKEVPNSLSRLVSETLDEQVRQDKLLRYDIPQLPSIMQDMNRKLNIRTVKWGEDGSESESNAGAAMAAGMVLTLLLATGRCLESSVFCFSSVFTFVRAVCGGTAIPPCAERPRMVRQNVTKNKKIADFLITV